MKNVRKIKNVGHSRLLTILAFSVSLTAVGHEGPTMGWSSWNTYRVDINDSLIMSQADAMVSRGLKEVGYSYINIDDGYFGGRAADGQLLIHPTRFPNGLKHIVDHIHSLGLKAGIYSDAGRNTCGNYYDKDSIAKGVGLYEHDQRDCNYFFNDLGFDFIKVDFCGGDGPQNTDRLTLDEQTRYTEIAKAIRKTGRKDVRLNVCRWDYPGTWVADIAASWRISHDISAHWGNVTDIIRQSLYLSAYCRNGRYNDMDMLEVGRGLGYEEDRTHFAIWCIMSSPLLIGCNIATMDDATCDLLKNTELIDVNQDRLCLQAYVAKHTGGCYLLVRDVEEREGLKRVFAVYNDTGKQQTMTVRFSDIDLAGKVVLRDLLDRKDTGTFYDSITLTIPKHGTKIFKATAEKRTMRKLYEAETAYISDYQELKNNQAAMTGIYERDERCSGAVKASWLGGKAQNDLVWEHVCVPETGNYRLTFACLTDELRDVNVSVNGKLKKRLTFALDGEKSVTVKLKKGDNIVRLWNDTQRMPDVDYMTVEK